MCIRPLEYFLETFEVKKFAKNKHKKAKNMVEISKFLSNSVELFDFIGF